MTVLPYLEVTAASYAAAYTAGLLVTGTQDGAVLSGTCPFDLTYTRRVYRHRPVADRSPHTVTVPVLCVCETAHEGRPADEEGCGAYWNVLLQRTVR